MDTLSVIKLLESTGLSCGKLIQDARLLTQGFDKTFESLSSWILLSQITHAPRLNRNCRYIRKELEVARHTGQTTWRTLKTSISDCLELTAKFPRSWDHGALWSSEWLRLTLQCIVLYKRLVACNEWLEATHVSCAPQTTSSMRWPAKTSDHSWRSDPCIDGVLNGTPISALADSGAKANFISLSHADHHGLPVERGNVGRARTANGTSVEIIGTTKLRFSFTGENEQHMLTFNVVERCIFDVILGASFLNATQTLSRWSQRIYRKMRKCHSYQVRYLGTPEQVMRGCFNSIEVDAALDTGSHGNFVSKRFAEKHGLQIDRDRRHQVNLEYFDGSRDTTCGVLRNATWCYGSAAGDAYQRTFYVIDGLEHDVLLGYDLLHDTKAFTRYKEHIRDLNEAFIDGKECALSPIIVKDKKRKVVAYNPRHAFEKEKGRLFTERDDEEQKLLTLPPTQRDEEWDRYMISWREKMADLESRMARTGPNSSSSDLSSSVSLQAAPSSSTAGTGSSASSSAQLSNSSTTPAITEPPVPGPNSSRRLAGRIPQLFCRRKI